MPSQTKGLHLTRKTSASKDKDLPAGAAITVPSTLGPPNQGALRSFQKAGALVHSHSRTATKIWFGLFTFHTMALPAVGVVDVLKFHPAFRPSLKSWHP